MTYLKCDADGCDHMEHHEAIGLEMIGKPCPKCGANLLTEQDYLDGCKVEALLKTLEVLGLCRLLGPDDDLPEGRKMIFFNPHNGKLNIEGLLDNDT